MFPDDEEDEDIMDLQVHPLWLRIASTNGTFNVTEELDMEAERFQNFYGISMTVMAGNSGRTRRISLDKST